MNIVLTKNNKQQLILLLFWCLVFLINTGPHWGIYSTNRELIETVGLVTGLQVIVALVAIKVLIPRMLNNGKRVSFIILLLLTTFIVCEIHILIRYLYIEPSYPASYERFFEVNGRRTLLERMFSLWTMKYLFFWKFPQHLYPAFILIAHRLYHEQQQLLKISEQKRKAELDALKNQLNPHFIFNTLNNLYALTIKKSDKAPIVIEQLSNILDYVIYRCNEDFVPLESEISLLESYISLEKVRYGERLKINFIIGEVGTHKIAPLILLTLVENACKHSSSEEIKHAKVDISLIVREERILFNVKNSRPARKQQGGSCGVGNGVGLANLRRQLELIYNGDCRLNIVDNRENYEVELVIKT